MKRPDLLVLVAIWAFLSAFLYFIGIAAIATFAIPGALGYYGPVNVGPSIGVDVGAIFGMSIGILVLICGFGLSLAGGIGILKAKNWGRIISIVNAIFSLFNIPIGTAIGILVLFYLTKPEVREYFEGSH